LQDNPGAVRHYRRALELEPNYPQALNNLATVHVRVNQFDEAIELFRRALRVRGDYADARVNLALALKGRAIQHQFQGAFAQAEALLCEAIANNPEALE